MCCLSGVTNMLIVLVVLSVSTLAVHGSIFSIDGLVIPKGCENKTFCEEKPVGYPEEEIDRLIMEGKLQQLHLMKRAAVMNNMPKIKAGSVDGNCEVLIESKTPYIISKEGQVPQLLVQSKFFKQTLTEVKCNKHYDESVDIQCFGALLRDEPGVRTKCVQKAIKTKLFVYAKGNSKAKIEEVDGELPVECVCVRL